MMSIRAGFFFRVFLFFFFFFFFFLFRKMGTKIKTNRIVTSNANCSYFLVRFARLKILKAFLRNCMNRIVYCTSFTRLYTPYRLRISNSITYLRLTPSHLSSCSSIIVRPQNLYVLSYSSTPRYRYAEISNCNGRWNQVLHYCRSGIE